MAKLLSPSSREIWNHVIAMGLDSTFTGSSFQQKFCPKVPYKKIYQRLNYLTQIGVLEKTNTWTGDNQIIYKVVDISKSPRAIDLSPLVSSTRRGVHTGKALYRGVKARIDAAAVTTTPAKKRPTDIVEGVNIVADLLTELLEAAKSTPAASIKNFTTAELFAELSNRTDPKAPA